MSDPANDPTCGCSEPVTGSYFVSAYPTFEAWTRGSLDEYRKRLMQRPARPEPLGLYVHIPFCERRCDFCYYLSYEGISTSEVDTYLDALPRELARYCNKPAIEGRPFDYVYFGGGTPSLLSLRRLDTLLTAQPAFVAGTYYAYDTNDSDWQPEYRWKQDMYAAEQANADILDAELSPQVNYNPVDPLDATTILMVWSRRMNTWEDKTP